MMKNDGGPAFPVKVRTKRIVRVGDGVETINGKNHCVGLSVRDYFAAKAMSSLVNGGDYSTSGWPQNIAEDAYQIADAMLKERKKC